MVKKGVFLVRFIEKSSAEKMVNKVGLHFDDKPIVVVPWSSDLEFDKGEVSSVQVWVQFLGLPMKYWNTKVLSKLASQLGFPLEMDTLTKQRKWGAFARMLIQMGLQEILNKFFTIDLKVVV